MPEQERGLALRGEKSIALSADDVVQNASHQAKLLMSIVLQTKCFQEISGKKYLQVEAWETIGAFNKVHAATESINPIMRDGETVGYDAKVNLINVDGVIVGSAIMPCYFTENACKGKEGDAKDKACKSAAQTFATSKAYRMNYSYVAILAGYEPVPAEEMSGEFLDDRPANLEHWCEKHQTKFFKRGKMKGYAHPIGDTGEWCNEDDQKQLETPPVVTTSKSNVLKTETSPVAPETKPKPVETEGIYKAAPSTETGTPPSIPIVNTEAVQSEKNMAGFVDWNWFIQSTTKTKWRDSDIHAFIRSKANYQGLNLAGTVKEIISRMTNEQAEFLARELQSRLELA